MTVPYGSVVAEAPANEALHLTQRFAARRRAPGR
jgi:hypothetical protein